ncbi:MAG: hypothetical protein SVZ03_03340 [Spirochaetota bacterium]|nr:hypothetical protein [Spirochaetota bacterium]
MPFKGHGGCYTVEFNGTFHYSVEKELIKSIHDVKSLDKAMDEILTVKVRDDVLPLLK